MIRSKVLGIFVLAFLLSFSFTAHATAPTITVGYTPTHSIAVGNKVYVISADDNTVSVINTDTESVETIPVTNSPRYLSAIGNKVFVTGNEISVIDITSNEVVDTLTAGESPYSAIIVGTNLYVNDYEGGGVDVFNTEDNSFITNIDAGGTLLYSTSVGNQLYSLSDNNTYSINTVTNTLSNTIPIVLKFIPSVVGKYIYAGKGLGNVVSVIDTSTDAEVDTIAVGGDSVFSRLANNKLYVGVNTEEEGSFVKVINTTNNTVSSSIVVSSPRYFSLIGSKLFLTSSGSNNVYVIDTESDTITDTIAVGAEPDWSSVVGNKLYVNNRSENTVSVIDSTTIPSQLPNLTSFSTSAESGLYYPDESIPITANFGLDLLAGSTMTVGLNTGEVVVLNNVSGSTLSGTYLISVGAETPDLAVTDILSANVTDSTNTYNRVSYDLPSSQGDFESENSFITRNIADEKNIKVGSYQTVDVGSKPYQVSSPVNGYIYVANQGDGTVSVVSTTTDETTATINVGSEPYGLAVATISSVPYVYVANINDDTVSVINTQTNTVSDTIDVGVKPYYVAVIGTNIYVTNGASNTVSVIDGTDNTVTDTITVGSYPRGIKAHGTNLYVANYGDPNYAGGNYISVINSLTNTVAATVILPVGSDGPRGVTVLNDKVYVTNFRSNNVSVIDTDDNEIIDTIDVGMGPRGIVGLGTTIYVENFDDGTISIIDTATNTVTDTVTVGSSPSGMGISGTDIYVSSFQDDKLYILDTNTNILEEDPDYVPPAEEEDEEVHHNSYGSTAMPVAINPLPQIIPTDCLPTYLYSPTTGAKCPSPQLLPITKYTFTKNLQLLQIDPDIKELQKYLNSHNTPVALVGPGSTNNETTKFGTLTYNALLKFQELHADEILKPAGLVKGTGYFGPATRAWVNSH